MEDYKKIALLLGETLISKAPETREEVEKMLPELKESEDERIRKEILEYFNQFENGELRGVDITPWIAWLEKQSNEPKWCHHKVDLSNCSEEYCKAYYDGWNNCNQQHSQCRSELDDVVKCFINGMKFYYEDNKEATWGTDKWSMPVKHIIEVLEKQGEQKPAWSEEDEEKFNYTIRCIEKQCFVDNTHLNFLKSLKDRIQSKKKLSEDDEERVEEMIEYLEELYNRNRFSLDELNDKEHWLKSLRPKTTWKPNDEQIKALECAAKDVARFSNRSVTLQIENEPYFRNLVSLLEQLKKLREE